MIETQSLILQILKEALNLGAVKLPTTKLVKILYLIEYEYYKQTRERLTDLDWEFHLYGPYAFELSSVLDNNIDLLETEERPLDADRIARLIGFGSQDEFRDRDFIDNIRVESITKSIVKEWYDEDIRSLLNYVYHETEPMQNIKRGDTLDFSSISEPLTLKLTPLSSEKILEMRKKFQSIGKPTIEGKPIYPLPKLSKEWQDKIEKALKSEFKDENEEINIKKSTFHVPLTSLKDAFEEE